MLVSKFVCMGTRFSFSATQRRWHTLEFAVMVFLASKLEAAVSPFVLGGKIFTL